MTTSDAANDKNKWQQFSFTVKSVIISFLKKRVGYLKNVHRHLYWFDNSLQLRHNGCDGVSNHQPHHCLLNRLFRRRWKKTSKLRVTGLCARNYSPHKRPVTWKMFPLDDVIMLLIQIRAWTKVFCTLMKILIKLVPGDPVDIKIAFVQILACVDWQKNIYMNFPIHWRQCASPYLEVFRVKTSGIWVYVFRFFHLVCERQ